ncbi:MAG: hypothetical protein ACTSQG_12025 [Promethearchaeota archaeon]
MPNYYLDIETDTEGRNKPDPLNDKIITIQYRPFYDDSGKPKGPLTILKSWESSEKDILKDFLEITGWDQEPRRMWDFIPSGVNLVYDLIVIKNRCKELLGFKIPYIFLFRDLPRMELKTILVMANRGNFKGSSFNRFSKKMTDGLSANNYIKEKDWDNLLTYINEEADAFFEIYQKLIKGIPELLPKL